jgi:hypothetical protein
MKTQPSKQFIIALSVFLSISMACSLPVAAFQPTRTPTTEPAQATIDAMLTQAAGQSTATQNAVVTAAPSATTAPSATLYPTQQTFPTATTQPSATSQPICDMASFEADISIPDGYTLAAGAQFIKTWRLRNSGACTWTADYSVVFSSGEAMKGAASTKIGVPVPPGQVVDISVPLVAP